MALTNCPECRKQISESVGSCPNCGYELTPEKIAEFKKMKQETRERSKREIKKFVKFVWLPFSGVVFVSFLISFFSDSPSSRSTTSSPRVERQYKQSWRDLSMPERKNIYLRVTDVPSGPQAERAVAEMARRHNISHDDVRVILVKGTFEWGRGHLP